VNETENRAYRGSFLSRHVLWSKYYDEREVGGSFRNDRRLDGGEARGFVVDVFMLKWR
jgi:hypothetical protein